MGREHQSRILFVSLLESYCRTYDDDPLRNRRLFFAICRTLYSMGIIGKEYVDEMSSIRATYSGAFRQLVAKAQESLDMYEQHDIETGIRSLMTGVAEDEDSNSDSFDSDHSSSAGGGWAASDSDSEYERTSDVPDRNRIIPHDELAGGSERNLAATRHLYTHGGSARGASATLSGASGNNNGAPTSFESMIFDMQRSRYHDDFIQLRCLGKGGFGKVYEVRNKLDGRRYAVKQIKIKGEITAEKTLREIKTLAHLDHPNIVRYYSSWIEVTRLRKKTCNDSNYDGGSVLGISPQSYGSLPQRQGTRPRHHYHTASAGRDEDCSFDLSTDDEVSFRMAGTQDGGCFEMSLTDDGDENDDEKLQLVEDSALECLDDTSGYSLWRTANLRDTVADDCNDCSNESSCQISFVDYGSNDADNDVVFVEASEKLSDKAGCCGSMSSTAVGGTKSCPSMPYYVTEPCDPPESQYETGTATSKGHQRRKSVHTVDNPYVEYDRTSKIHLRKINRSPQSVNDSFASTGQQAQSLPSQGMLPLSGIVDAGQQALVAETSLLVQMQLCQTTLQEYLVQRNERISKRQADAACVDASDGKCCASVATAAANDDDDWCPLREHDLLIDPVMNVRLFRAIVEGVKYFHNRGVIHRDLKGANVFLDLMYSDSGGNPISRGGSGIGRPDSHSKHQQQSQLISSMHPLSRAIHGGGLVSVHSDIWDAVDGGNLKEKIHAAPDISDTGEVDRGAGSASVPALPLGESTGDSSEETAANAVMLESRKVDWDSIFDSILAHRSINGTRTGNVFGERASLNPNDTVDSSDNIGTGRSVRKMASSSQLSSHAGQQSLQMPPAVSFIPRIGDFGLATKSTLGIRARGDEYAFISDARGTSTKQSSSTSIPNDADTQIDQERRAPGNNGIASESGCDTRRTSNVGTITYAAPEQLSDRATDYSEKADIYSLGIIFFELYYPFSTAMERIAVIRDLRRGVFPPQFLQMWPKEAALILQLMDADPTKRPSAKDILSLDLIDVPTLESAQLKREVNMLRQQLRIANQRNEELGLRVRELEKIVDMNI
ncbi:hypothetical protein EV175_000391 [Coemansia sp. RSA 1933]|nr:hypothetical protein EV175_000391 [Coemansia sp. RSA 1933]